MGEMGFPRQEFLHSLKWWEIKSIIRGYRRRERTLHLLTRRLAFWQVKTSMADTSKIHREDDLWRLPWDDEDENRDTPDISDKEVARMRAEMAELNKQLAAEAANK